MTKHSSSRASREDTVSTRLAAVISGVLLVALGLVAVLVFSAGADTVIGRPTSHHSEPAETEHKVGLSALVESTTHTRLDRAPIDRHPQRATQGWVVRPEKMIRLFDAPRGLRVPHSRRFPMSNSAP
ncbi:MAG: hypothetical protein GEV00_05245 [Actinophytocola sp.]|nr:hypothetical protein [Actinophytocola sp.]